jgi:uncharacterized protein YbbC (DUF1343 family)
MTRVQFGLDQIISGRTPVLNDRRFAVVMNRASVDDSLRLTCDALAERFPGQLRAVLTPQHGLWCEQQANMIETGHGWLSRLQVPVFSLYSDTRRPTDAMLQNIDCLVVDLQDVGTRVYTFLWTLLYCLQECARRKIDVVVLDRPNPIGGELIEGPLLDIRYRSFVGEWTIPMRHGLTIGELAQGFQQELVPDVSLTVVPLDGWSRSQWFDELSRVWIPPSPNMPTVQTAGVYPGQVLLEGTNLSEGRGTTVPFEVVGAPFLEPESLALQMNDLALPGVRCLPIRFEPSFDKWAGQSCGGVSIHVTDRQAFRPWTFTLRLLQVCRELSESFRFNPPPYEYEHRLPPIDIIAGSPAVREWIDGHDSLEPCLQLDAAAWIDRTRSWRLYAS